ncbi:MAG: hypothetical protein ABJA67_05500 [Chthonomonadales bacterium]
MRTTPPTSRNWQHVISRIVGVVCLAFSLWMFWSTYTFLNLSLSIPSHLNGEDIKPVERIPGAIGSCLLFGIPTLVIGLRLLIKPVLLNENVPCTRKPRWRSW